jgi:hypothetical protein
VNSESLTANTVDRSTKGEINLNSLEKSNVYVENSLVDNKSSAG